MNTKIVPGVSIASSEDFKVGPDGLIRMRTQFGSFIEISTDELAETIAREVNNKVLKGLTLEEQRETVSGWLELHRALLIEGMVLLRPERVRWPRERDLMSALGVRPHDQLERAVDALWPQ